MSTSKAQSPNGKTRSPTKRRTKTTKSQSAVDVLLFALQCSQRLGQWITLLFMVHVLTTLAGFFINIDLCEYLISLMGTCSPVYGIGIGGYFGKAAVENVLKIRKSIATMDNYNDTENDGNG